MSKLIRLVGLCLFLLCLCKPSLVLSEAPLKKPTTQNIQTKKVSWGRVKLAIVNKDFGSALRWLKEIKPTASFSAEQKLFWLGRVQWQAKQYKASAKSLLQFVRTFPNSRLRSKAELMAAQALARSRRYGGAQKIFEKHLKRMLSPARRLEIARVYLRYANAYYKKAKAKNKFANYAKAIKMFKHSLGLGLPSKETRKVMLQLGTAYLRRNRKWMASATFEKAYKKYRKSRFAEQYVYYWALSQYKIGYSRI